MTLKQAMSRSQSHPTGESRAPAASDHAGSVGSSPAILQSAARHVILQWRQRIGETPAAPEIADLMVVLATSIVEAQITAAPVIDERVRSSLGRHLLEQLRREVVRRWTESGVADSELPPLLVAIERVRDALEPTPTEAFALRLGGPEGMEDRKSTRLNSSHTVISYAVFCLKKKKIQRRHVDCQVMLSE